MAVATSPERTAELLKLLGDLQAVDRDLQAFRRTAELLSSGTPRLIDQYSNQWIALYDGQVTAHGPTLHSVLAQVDSKGLPRGKVIVRFIDRMPRTMIL